MTTNFKIVWLNTIFEGLSNKFYILSIRLLGSTFTSMGANFGNFTEVVLKFFINKKSKNFTFSNTLDTILMIYGNFEKSKKIFQILSGMTHKCRLFSKDFLRNAKFHILCHFYVIIYTLIKSPKYLFFL